MPGWEGGDMTEVLRAPSAAERSTHPRRPRSHRCHSGITRITFHLSPDMLMDLLNHSPDLCCCRYN